MASSKRARTSEGEEGKEGTGQPARQGAGMLTYTYATRYSVQDMPKHEMPKVGAPARVAKQLIEDERLLDSNPRLNLASFVTTWMEPEVEELMMKSMNVNYVDTLQYPSCTEFQNRCVAMLADLFNAVGRGDDAVGTAAIGSSEAIMLGGLAMKMKWRKALMEKKLSAWENDPNKTKTKEEVVREVKAAQPNLVLGYNVQVCWEKFCRYFEVEERFVHLKEGQYTLTPHEAVSLVDENTIGVCGILGSTYNGEFDDLKGLNDALAELNKAKGWDVSIHVDAASGGFIAPFQYPDLEWDFRLPLVRSINVSGHKYGLVYAGVGWVVWRDRTCLPEELVFHTNYLGSDQPSITLNFSKGASQIVAQYYNFIRLGFEGYKSITTNLRTVADYLTGELKAMGHFKMLHKDVGVPLVAFSIAPLPNGHKRMYDEFALSDKMRESGWTLPAYTMAPDAGHVKLLRAVVREDMSIALADKLVQDLKRAIAYLDHHFLVTPEQVKEYKSEVIEEFLKKPHKAAPKKKKFNGVC